MFEFLASAPEIKLSFQACVSYFSKDGILDRQPPQKKGLAYELPG